MVQRRQDREEMLAKGTGRMSADELKVGDKVRLRNHTRVKWDSVGVIKEERSANGKDNISFIIELENGNEALRHKAHLRHKECSDKRRQPQICFEDNTTIVPDDDSQDNTPLRCCERIRENRQNNN